MKKHLQIPLLALLGFMLLSITTLAQNYTIKGKIVSQAGNEPLAGTSVLVKGTTLGTVADAKGEYTLRVNLKEGNYELVFRSIGYKNLSKAITLGSSTNLNLDISLADDDAFALDEVVFTGSTLSANKRELGNTINSVKAEELQKSGATNVFSALQGKVPGAQITQNSGDPSGGISIRLRGTKSLRGSSDPLYVIDGVVVSNSSTNVSQVALSDQAGAANLGTNRMADVNPNDIETINVLNGAAAAAVYGSRASNGVIIITTKRGKSGAPKVTFSTSVNVNELRKKVFVSTYGKQFGFAGLRLHTIGGISAAQIAANPGVTTVGIVRDGATTQLATNLVDVTRYDYQDQIYRTGLGTDNYLSITGGTEKTQYLASISYMKNQGIIKGSDFQRYGLKVRVDQHLTNWAKVSAGLNYINSFSNEKPNGNVFYSPINSVNITNNIYDITKRDAAGNLLAVEPSRVNPLSTIEDMDFTQSTNRTIADLQLNLTPLKGLTIDWIVGIDAFSQLGKNTIKPYPYATEAGLPLERYPLGFAAIATSNTMLFNTDVNIGYDKYLSDNLHMTLTGGFNHQYSQTDFTTTTGQNLAPFITTISGASSTSITGAYGLDRYAVTGQFFQATFGYKNKAFLTGAIRRDGSTIFSPDQTNQLYPKISGSYVLLEGQDGWLNGAKLRASFGDAGGLTALGTYDRFWQFSPAAYLGKSTILPGRQLANPSVKPERMRELEFGGDFSLVKNKISLGVTYYAQKISDLVVNRVLAASSGGTSIVNNVGEMENKGFEISLGASLVKTKDFKWDANVVFSSNRNKITKLPGGNVAITNVAGAPIFLIEGQPASVFYGNPYARNADGSYLLTAQGFPQRERGTQNGILSYTPQRDDKGQPTGAFINTIIGNPNPDWTGSFSSNFQYKRLSFRFLLDAVQGVDVFNADKRTRNNVGIGDIADAELKGTLPRGTAFALVPIEEYRVDNGSFVKLRELSLGYSFPKLLAGKYDLNVSLVGRNLVSWDNYNGYDPETNAGGNSSLLRGVDFGNVPIPRTYQLTVTANF
ncbi:SusC/RagA family TonB-linked outer membrane protein [Flectobacillus major]|uniref:SusC/RagA family TonB-linked outer membrane protein n=1 Tax=Flectobacillus major TaxID=103 RepID=UPI0003F8595D|nr:SusC/RagA family TonB-linked outer membrane protein [Flectobacillus major]